MSEARRIRRAIERKSRKAALRSRHAQGCTCAADARVTGWIAGAIPFVEVFHDSWCAALRSEEGPAPTTEFPEVLSALDPELARLQLRLLEGGGAT